MVGEQSPSQAEIILNTEKEKVAQKEEKSGWEEKPRLLSFKFLPRSQDEPRGGKHQDQVHCNDEVYDSKLKPREKNGRLVIEQRQGGGEGGRERDYKNCLHSKFRLFNKLFISTKDGDR